MPSIRITKCRRAAAQRVLNFIDSVDLFLKMLLSVCALPEGEEFPDDHVIATVCCLPHFLFDHPNFTS